MMMGQWSDLGEDLLKTIEEKLVLYIDKVRFRAVCVSWRIILSKMPNHQARQLPWLFHALDNNRDASHGLFNPIEKKVYLLDLPEDKGKLFKGSSNGWVATLEDISISPAIYLTNPLTRSRIKLPPRTTFPDVESYDPDRLDDEYALLLPDGSGTLLHGATIVNRNLMDKIVLSSTPSRDNCVVVSIYGSYGRLAYCKRNDEKWTFFCKEERGTFMDIIFHEGKLHALKPQGQLLVFENMDPNSKVTQIASQLPRRTRSYLYLVESSNGGLIMVARHVRERPREDCEGVYCFYKTSSFRVYKHDPINLNWSKVKSIGEEILFVGHNSSMSIFSCPGFKGNRIYFSDNVCDYHKKGIQGGSDIGVFNLDNTTIESSLPGFKCDPTLVWPPPIWVIPSLY